MKAISKKLVSPGVWNCIEKFPRFSHQEGLCCLEEIVHSPSQRARVCMHPTIDDRMQEMFIAFDGKSYVRPSVHLNKDESFHVIDGFGKYLFFDDHGNFTNDVRLGPYNSDLPFYCRIPGNQAHSLIVFSKQVLAHEVMTGPFDKANTRFPSWSQDLQTDIEKENFRNEYSLKPVSSLAVCKFERMTEEMCRANPGVFLLRRSDMNYLKSEVYKTSRKRIRLCIHNNDDALLHEMFVVYTDVTYVRPNMHLGKDESLHILEGEADFIFFDEAGHVIEVVPLGDQSSNKNFFVRVPQGIFHTIIMRSAHLVIHEATPGPFNRLDTVWASWAPVDSDTAAVAQFQNALEKQITVFCK